MSIDWSYFIKYSVTIVLLIVHCQRSMYWFGKIGKFWLCSGLLAIVSKILISVSLILSLSYTITGHVLLLFLTIVVFSVHLITMAIVSSRHQ